MAKQEWRERNLERYENRRSGRLAGGILLVLLGITFLVYQIYPDTVKSWFGGQFPWPLFVMIPGALLLLTGLLSRTGGFVIPGSIVTGIGALLYYQNLTGRWESWAYAWTLIPGFVGLGLLLASLVDPATHDARRTGLYMAGISLAVFALFASAFGFGLRTELIWPVVLILLGLGFLVGAFRRR